MNLSESELSVLNDFLNGCEDLPVDVEALNVKLREHFSQDTSVEAPEVQAAVAEAEAAQAPTEDAPVAEASVVDTSVDETPVVPPVEDVAPAA